MKEPSKKERVLSHIKSRLMSQAKTSDVIGLSRFLFHNRCLRDAQELVAEGRLWRLRHDLKLRYYGDIKEEVFTAIQADAEIA